MSSVQCVAMPARALWAGLACVLLLAGCGAENVELQEWMDQQRKLAKPNVEPVEAPKKFVPQAYVSINGTEPFSTQKLVVGSPLDARQSNALLESETRRRKEPLEAYPLDSMAMVGSVVRQGRPYALIKVDNLLHYVKAGEYLGQNFGKITGIGETAVSLREIVQDASGEWVERTTTLQLQ
jgi:type IV pilus assembly protein PilP